MVTLRIHSIMPEPEDDIVVAKEAIKQAIRALRKRHLVEEAAHAPAFLALSRPILSQGSEWKTKAENLELELQQCYKAQARLSEQLVVEVAESRESKTLVQEKEALITDLENELAQLREECSRLNALLAEKTEALELIMTEHNDLKTQLEAATVRADDLEAENKMLIDRWMLQKMQEAEHLNEANATFEDMMNKTKASSIEQLARRQVDGVVRLREEDEYCMESTVPSICKQQISAHDGGCDAIMFEHNSTKLISGGQDRVVNMWDTTTGALVRTFHGCVGSVIDLSITHDNRTIIAASVSNNLVAWDVNSGRARHTLTGHVEKVCAVDVSKVSSRHVVSSAYDRHVDGCLRLWDIQTGKLLSEVAAHSLAVTSLSLSHNGNLILTSGRDNMHNLFDMRSLEICGTFRANGSRVASNWSRSCLSSDDNYIAAGSADGSVLIWSTSNGSVVSTLKKHKGSVVCCTWSGFGKPLATSDKNGSICIWA
ncbi:unnamed protein product [Coffea canephora]|uniref:Autophagy-related protein 16 domain-containing protein n=1 Tax=Coffea canephora TaxID=49390 RepID=A0A068V5C3_COFCA|nr:unnamed protein product [Coffea canephora]